MGVQQIHYANKVDVNGHPAGGYVEGIGLDIQWQNGPLGAPDDPSRIEPNGTFVESVIEAAIVRLEFYQGSQFHCVENAVALGHLRAALEVLEERTRARTHRGVEGTHEV